MYKTVIPFTRKDNLYNVVDYDRYVYHIVGIEQPADPVLVGAYNVLIKQIMEDARAAIAAKREAKAKAASFVLLQWMMTTCHSNEHGATDLRVGSTDCYQQ